jgi:hypothetical protein
MHLEGRMHERFIQIDDQTLLIRITRPRRGQQQFVASLKKSIHNKFHIQEVHRANGPMKYLCTGNLKLLTAEIANERKKLM